MKRTRSDLWKYAKHPLILLLITGVILLLRIVLPAIPGTFLVSLRYLIMVYSQALFGEDWVLWDLFLGICLALTAVCVPAAGKWNKLRQFLVRPVAAILVFCLFTPVTNAATKDAQAYAREQEDIYWQKKIDAYCQEVSAFLDEADQVVLHSSHSQNYSPYFQDSRIQCVCGAYHSVIMIDYDTMRIAFLRHDWITDFYIYELQPGALTAENEFVQLDTLLPQSEVRLISYYPDEDNHHRTCALELILADGTVYSTTDTPDEYWDNGFLGINYTTADDIFCVGDPHPED